MRRIAAALAALALGCGGSAKSTPREVLVDLVPEHNWWHRGLCPWDGQFRRKQLRHRAVRVWCEIDGVPHGPYAVIESGSVTAVGVQQAGKQHGVRRTFHANGSVATRTSYRRGLRHGVVTIVDRDGSYTRGEYTRDRKTGTWTTWRADGVVARVETYEDGRRIAVRDVATADRYDYERVARRWWTEARPCPVGATLAGSMDIGTLWCQMNTGVGVVEHGPFSTFHEPDKVMLSGNYYAGVRRGSWTLRDEHGALQTETTYARGLEHGQKRIWHADGSREEMTYARGAKTGPYRRIDAENTVRETGWYDNGEKTGEWVEYLGLRVIKTYWHQGKLQGRDVIEL